MVITNSLSLLGGDDPGDVADLNEYLGLDPPSPFSSSFLATLLVLVFVFEDDEEEEDDVDVEEVSLFLRSRRLVFLGEEGEWGRSRS